MKRLFAYTLLLLCTLLLTGCSASTTLQSYVQATPVGAVDIPALPDENAGNTLVATLYFRYADTALLRQEVRSRAASVSRALWAAGYRVARVACMLIPPPSAGLR